MKYIISLLMVILIAGTLLAENLVVDKDILKRTPKIDGKIVDGEWDIFYNYTTTDNDKVTTYVNWDTNNLYLGISCKDLSGIAIALDLNADGWTVGDDNYLITTNDNGDLDVLKAIRVNDSGISLIAVQLSDSKRYYSEQGVNKDNTNTEIKIPANLLDLKSFKESKMNLNLSIKTGKADWNTFNPKDLTDNTLACKLVNYKSYALDPLKIDFVLDKEIIAAGDTLDGKVRLSNKGTEPIKVKEFIMAGEGLSEDYVNSYKIKLEEIKPGKTFVREYHSQTTSTIPVGTWVLGCEIYSNDIKIGGVLKSFEIITPTKVLPYVPKEIVYSNEKQIRIGAKIVNYSSYATASGYASVVLPNGWKVEGNNKNKYTFSGYNKYTDLVFRVTPPLGTLGEVEIPVIVTTPQGQETVVCKFLVVQSKD